MGNRGGRQTTWRRRLRTGAALAVAVAASGGGLLAPPAEAGFLRTHRSDSAASTQPNDFKQMLIADVGTGQVAGRAQIPQDGIPDVLGITDSTINGQLPGFYRILQRAPGVAADWGLADGSGGQTNSGYVPTDLQQGPSPSSAEEQEFFWSEGFGQIFSEIAFNSRTGADNADSVVRAHPQVSIAVGKITSTQDAIVQLLSDDSFAFWPIASNGTGLRDPGSYMAAPTGTHICGGHILLADIAGNSLPDIIQYGDRCGGGDSGIEVWVGNTGPADYSYQGYYSVGAGLQSVQVADLNGDGHNDLAMTFAASLTSGAGAYAVALYDASQTLLNQPSLHFAFQPDNNSTPERQPLAGGAGALQIGDVAAPASPSSDTDGHPDLVVAQPQTGHIAVLANDPANPGAFSLYGTPFAFGDGALPAGQGGPDGLTLGRINADNRLDILAWAHRPNQGVWEVFQGTRAPTVTVSASAAKAFANTDVTFTAAATAPAASPSDAAVDHVDWDFNGDGTFDQTTTGLLVTHQFAAVGDYDVIARIVNSAGDATTVHLPTPLRIGTQLRVALTPKPGAATPGTATDFTATATGGYPGPGGTAPTLAYTFTTDAPVTSHPQSAVLRATWPTATRGTVGVSVTDGQGQTVTDSDSVRVADPLIASLGPQNARNLMVGEQREIVAVASGGIGALHYRFDLDGNGTYETDAGTTGQAPVTFSAVSTPTVGVQVTDSDPAGGVSTTATTNLIVRPKLTAALTQSPATPAPGQAVTLDASDSSGGEIAGTPPYAYAWTLDGTALPSETGPTLTRTFANPGHHTVGLGITDAYGRTDTATRALKIAAPLVPTFTTTPTDPQIGETVHFDPSATTGGIPPYTYAWDLDGDGVIDPPTAQDSAPTHTYSSSQVVQVGLVVTDADGVRAAVTLPLGVAAQLTAALRVLPAAPGPGRPVTFDASTTVGGSHPYSYAWTIDGTVQTAPGDDAQSIQRTFAAPGHHTVALAVTDHAGHASTVAGTPFTVADPLVAAFSSAPAQPQTGEQVAFDAGASAGGIPPLHYAWDFDGSGSYQTSTGTTAAVQHTFGTAGVDTVGLQVTDADGNHVEITHVVQVAPALGVTLTHVPAIPAPGQTVTLTAAGVGGAGQRTFAWGIDDPGFPTSTGATPSLQHTFSTKGDHAVGVAVTDGGGHRLTAQDTVTVADPLVARLTDGAPHPETGDTVTLDASSSSGGVGARHYRFDLNGDGIPDTAASTSPTATTALSVPGTARFGVQVTDDRGQQASTIATTDVTRRLVPDFVVPAPITNDQPATFDASPTSGGTPPLHFEWDLNGDGTYETASGANPTQSAPFAKVGPATVGLRVTDALGHTRDMRKAITVLEGCLHTVSFGLTTIDTATSRICLRRTSGAAGAPYVADGDITLNGMTITKPSGATLTITPPIGTAAARLTATAVQVREAGSLIVNGAIDWKLPAGTPGQEHSIGNVGLAPSGLDLLGLHVEGRIGLALGENADGSPYVRISPELAIPGFKLSDDKDSPGVTGEANFRVDARGPHLDAIKIQVDHAKLQGLDVNQICLSYLAAGAQGNQCEQFADHSGEPFLTCATDATQNRWNGTMDITLPGKNDAGFAFSGELAGGQLANVAAKAELGHSVALAEGVFLKSIAAGICLKPAPLKLRGEAVVTAIPESASGDAVEIDGSFLYTDAIGATPWSISLQGGLTLLGHHVADAYASLDGSGALAVGWHQRLQLPNDDVNVASIDGTVDGWMRGSTFDVEGGVSVCLVAVYCIDGQALVSTDGAAACVTLATVYYPIVSVGYLYTDVSYGSYDIRGGFGYRWGGSVDVMGGSCDIGPWRPAGAPGATASAAGQPYSFQVGPGEILRNLRLHGAGAAPEVTVRGPGGTVIATNPSSPVTQQKGSYLLLKDAASHTTVVQLIKPAPGTWTITPATGSTIAGVDTAPLLLPPAVGARVRHDRHGYHVDYAWTPQTGVAMRFTARRGNLAQDLGPGRVTPCPGKVQQRSARKIAVRCGTLDFLPVDGPGGLRRIEVRLTRGGVPVATRTLAHFRVPAPAKPGRVPSLRLARTNRGVIVTWGRAGRAVRYAVTAVSAEGYRVLYAHAPSCREITLPRTATTSTVDVTVRGISAHGVLGVRSRLHLRARARLAGARAPASRPCGA